MVPLDKEVDRRATLSLWSGRAKRGKRVEGEVRDAVVQYSSPSPALRPNLPEGARDGDLGQAELYAAPSAGPQGSMLLSCFDCSSRYKSGRSIFVRTSGSSIANGQW